jgi:putative addiction module component (TIGR02574 family)
MSQSVHELHEKVMGLSPEDRATLLELLLASLEPKSAAQRAWVQLASRRREDVRSGKVHMVPADEAVARIRAKLA